MRIASRCATFAGMALACLLVVAGCEPAGDEQTTVEGEGGKKLTLVSPGDVTVARGGTAEVSIGIGRTKLKDKVSVEFTDLPGGVSVVNSDKNIVGDEATFRLQASDSADLVANHQAKVTARADESDLAATQMFRITVQESE